jgi:hypothetical protein
VTEWATPWLSWQPLLPDSVFCVRYTHRRNLANNIGKVARQNRPWVFSFLWLDSPIWAWASSFRRGFTITHFRHTTVGRTPLDEGPARRRDLYQISHNTHKRQTSMPPVEFEPTILVSERPKTHALDSTATGIGGSNIRSVLYIYIFCPSDLFHLKYCEQLGPTIHINTAISQPLPKLGLAPQTKPTWKHTNCNTGIRAGVLLLEHYVP